MADDRIAGSARDIGGKIEAAAVNLTGNAKMQAQGTADQVAGKAEKAFGEAKDAISSTADDAEATIGGMAGRLSSQASDLGGQAYEQGAKAAKYVSKQITTSRFLRCSLPARSVPLSVT